MSEQGSTGYGPSRFARLQFGGEEDKFEAWETRFLGYMELNDLKKVLDMTAAPTDAGDIAKNAKAYAQLIMVLDDTSLGLVMRAQKEMVARRCRSFANITPVKEMLGS